MLECEKEMIQILAIHHSRDVRNCTDKLFHIDPQVRKLWKTIEAKVEESK